MNSVNYIEKTFLIKKSICKTFYIYIYMLNSHFGKNIYLGN